MLHLLHGIFLAHFPCGGAVSSPVVGSAVGFDGLVGSAVGFAVDGVTVGSALGGVTVGSAVGFGLGSAIGSAVGS